MLVCDHASNRLPRRLGMLGLSAVHLADHIAWDPGAADVARRLSDLLDAPLVLSGYSRLVIDYRPLDSPESIPAQSDGVPMPGNRTLTSADRALRIEAVFNPYHEAIRAVLDRRAGRPSLLLSIHSFTPVLAGQPRPWAIGFLDPPYESGLAVPALQALASRHWIGAGAVCLVEVAAREPLAPPPGYAVVDERTYGVGRLVFPRYG